MDVSISTFNTSGCRFINNATMPSGDCRDLINWRRRPSTQYKAAVDKRFCTDHVVFSNGWTHIQYNPFFRERQMNLKRLNGRFNRRRDKPILFVLRQPEQLRVVGLVVGSNKLKRSCASTQDERIAGRNLGNVQLCSELYSFHVSFYVHWLHNLIYIHRLSSTKYFFSGNTIFSL